MKTVHIIVGTRPEAIKMAPVYEELSLNPSLRVRLVSTGQHQTLTRQALHAFGMKPDYDLQVMRHGQTLSQLTANLLVELELLFKKEKPDLILAHGDTTTCYATALSAFYHTIPLFHVEAGLRTFRLDSPFPEEFNRQCVSKMAAHHFAPTDSAQKNLVEEGISSSVVTVTGSTVFDAIELSRKLSPHSMMQTQSRSKSVVFTLHRREQGTTGLRQIMDGIRSAADRNLDTSFIFPVHPNPVVQSTARDVFSSAKNVTLMNPLEYPEFLALLSRSSLVLTDSGGVQEEAAYLGKQVLILRDISERPDGFTSGTTKIIGTNTAAITSEINRRLALHSCDVLPDPIASSESPSKIIANVVGERCS